MSQTRNKKIPSWLIESLPKEIRAEKVAFIPQRFEDSTHDLWRLQSKQRNYFIKVCSNTESSFWQIMQQLFGVNLQQDIKHFETLYRHIAKLTSLQIPEIVKVESIRQQSAYILTKELKGSVPDHSKINNGMVEQLAQHLAELHKDQRDSWGLIHQPLFKSNEWRQRLSDTLEKSAYKWGGELAKYKPYLESALEACNHLNASEFVPLMPDLRWDQLLITKDYAELILLDLDAFVLAPREMDFILLEYLLDQQQIEVFIEVYSQHHAIPDLKYARPAYRLLLFFMEVLGEQDIDKWMNVESLF